MKSPAEFLKDIRRLYPGWISRPDRDCDFPFTYSLGRIRWSHILEERQTSREWESFAESYPFLEILHETRTTRSQGNQTLPVGVRIPAFSDYLELLGLKEEWTIFRREVDWILSQEPKLVGWVGLRGNYGLVLENAGKWEDLLSVCRYFQTTPRSERNLYIRELPLTVHTKFLEENSGILKRLLDTLLPETEIRAEESNFSLRYGLRLPEEKIRFRVLDSEISRTLCNGWTDISLPLSEFGKWGTETGVHPMRVLIVENLTCFLTLPPACNTLALFGKGFQVGMLRQVAWLSHCEIFYWGDMDLHGMQILSLVRSIFSHTKALMMDHETWETFSEFRTEGSIAHYESLNHLTREESIVVEKIRESSPKNRLEQERIPYAYATRKILDLFEG